MPENVVDFPPIRVAKATDTNRNYALLQAAAIIRANTSNDSPASVKIAMGLLELIESKEANVRAACTDEVAV